MAKILITGGAGYVGSHLAWKFRDFCHNVVICDNFSTSGPLSALNGFKVCEIDVRDARFHQLVSEIDPDVLIHCAAKTVVPESMKDPGSYYDVNLVGSVNVIRVAASLGVRVVLFSSTAAVYRPSASGIVSESSPIDPSTPYGKSKWMSEVVMRDVASASSVSLGILRYFNVAGADRKLRTGQSTPNATHLIKAASHAAIHDEKLNLYGDDYGTDDGTCVRDFIDVCDLAEAHRLYAEALLNGEICSPIYNCGNGIGYSVREVVGAVEEVTGKSIRIINCPRRDGDLPKVVADATLIKEDLGWGAGTLRLADIVRSALEWEDRLRVMGK